MLFRNFFKKIFIIYIVLSLILFSPISYALPPVVAGSAVAGAVLAALNSPLGKKVLKEIGEDLLGGDDDIGQRQDDDGSVTFYYTGNQGDCSHGSYKDGSPDYIVTQVCKSVCTDESSVYIYPIDSERTSYNFTITKSVYQRDYHASFACKTTPVEKKLTAQEVADEIEKRAKKGDKDAQDVLDDINKRIEKNKSDDDSNNKKDKSDDDSSDDKDKNKDDDSDDSNKNKDKSDDDDDTSSDDECKAKTDDDDTSKECKDKSDDDTAKKDDDDDKTCNSSAFHKKVCDWIDWTYDETDKAKKKIAEFFSDDEIDDIDKKKLNELVDETDVALKKSDFDVIDACPAPKSVSASFLGRTVDIEVFNFQGVCKYAGFIEFALQTTATIIGINIIAGRRTD